MLSLDRTTFNELVDFLTPFMLEENARRALLRRALNDKLYRQIEFSGSAEDFTVQLIGKLLDYGEVEPGKPAVLALLEIIRDRVGVDRQQEIDTFIGRLNPTNKVTHRLPYTSSLDQPYAQADNIRSTEDAHPAHEFLPYMVDRHEQENELAERIKRLDQHGWVPVVCLIYGDHLQCHDMFLRRLQHVMLPKMLIQHPEQSIIQKYLMPWPGSFQSVAELHERLRKNLADEVCGYSGASRHQINKQLASRRVSALIRTTLLYPRDWQHRRADPIKDFLQFWNDWPDLMPQQRLFICLCIEYECQFPFAGKRGLVRRFPFFQSAHHKLEAKIAEIYQEYHAASLFNRLTFAALKRLENVTEKDVQMWAQVTQVKLLCRGSDLSHDIRLMFEKWKKDYATETIPMERIVPELNDLIYKYTGIERKPL